MFVYLSKRITIPNSSAIACIGWNEEQGWLACGGSNGLLKVLKVDGGMQGQKTGGLSLNQTLEGHEGTVSMVTWNQQYRKLTSCDDHGRIIVWTLHKGMWFEEMVNNRNESVVVDLMWNVEGTRICIAYADGAVIVGAVDGNRLWGHNFDYALARACWSPDDQHLLLGTTSGDVYVHDAATGKLVTRVLVQREGNGSGGSGGDDDGGDAAVVAAATAAGVAGKATPRALAGLAWHHAWVDRPTPLATLAVCTVGGRLQLMDRMSDDKPYLIDTGLLVRNVAWNPRGTVLAIAGLAVTMTGAAGDAASASAASVSVATQFFSNDGVHLRTLRLSGRHCGGVTWEGDGLRVAIAVDSSVYFANVRPDYKYCYFKKTLVFAFHRPDRVEDAVTFWHVKSNERTTRSVAGLLHMCACKDACVLVSRPSSGSSGGGAVAAVTTTTTSSSYASSSSAAAAAAALTTTTTTTTAQQQQTTPSASLRAYAAAATAAPHTGGAHHVPQQSMVQLLNAIGSPIETRFLGLVPYVCAINSSHVVCCGEENVYLWQFRDPAVVVDALDPVSVQVSRSVSHERIVHIDDVVRPYTESTMVARSALTNDLICAVCLGEQHLLVGRESGVVHLYQLTPLQLTGKLLLPSRAYTMAVNCDCTALAMVDPGGVLRVYAIEKDRFALVPSRAEALYGIERKDVWGVRWADDDPALLAVMEKTRMYLYRGGVAEEPVPSCASICKFSGLRVRAMQLDELMVDPERPRRECLVDYEVKELRELRARMAAPGASMKDVFAYVDEQQQQMLQQQSHTMTTSSSSSSSVYTTTTAATAATATAAAVVVTGPQAKLWRLLASHALSKLDFAVAEMAFIRCADYAAIQFVKRIRALDDPRKQLAEVDAYGGRVDEAEKTYKDMDRKDLALELRHRMGDWFGVVRLVQEGGGDESLMREAWEQIGDHYANRQKWLKASQYYTQCRNYRKLAHVFYTVDDFDMLAQLVTMAEHDKELLLTIGNMFLTVGLAEEAARAFVAAGEPQRAVDGCVELNLWEQAIALARTHRTHDVVEQLLGKCARYLLARERLPEAIELHRKAGQHDAAARLLARLGQRAAATSVLKAKKFYVLAALEVDKHRRHTMALSKGGGAVVDDLLNAEGGGSSGGGNSDVAAAAAATTTTTQRALDTAWRGAEAYHFYLMCQQHIVDRGYDTALVLAMRLTQYDDLVAPVDAYSLVALTAYLAGNYGLCSNAFTRLEAMERNDAVAATASTTNTGSSSSSGGGSAMTATMAAVAAAATLRSSGSFTMDLDVTQRTAASSAATLLGASGAATAAGGGGGGSGSALEGTTTSLQLITAGAGAAAAAVAATYPTVSLAEPTRRYANVAVRIFTRHRPVDTSVNSVPCATCGVFNKEWATRCVQCQQPFGVCIVTGRAIVAEEDAWRCGVCQHLAMDAEVERFRNCPLCHSLRKQRLRRAL